MIIKKSPTFFLPIFLLIFLSLNMKQAEAVKIKRIINSNTLLLTNGKEVRLIGIDIPKSQPNEMIKDDLQHMNQDIATANQTEKEATEFINKLAAGQKVKLEYDIQKKDKDGKILAYVFLLEKLDELPLKPENTVGTSKKYGNIAVQQDSWFKFHLDNNDPDDKLTDIFLNATIINYGYATPLTILPNVKYAELFQKLYKEAREKKRGLWR